MTGKIQADVAELLGVASLTVGIWWRAYKANPENGLKVKKRGREIDADCTFSETKARKIQQLIVTKVLINTNWSLRYGPERQFKGCSCNVSRSSCWFAP